MPKKRELRSVQSENIVHRKWQTLGIVGFGKTGRAVAKRAAAFGFDLIAYDPYIPEKIATDIGAKLVTLDNLLETSDIITVHMNLTSENQSFFNKEVFKKMKKHPILIKLPEAA